MRAVKVMKNLIFPKYQRKLLKYSRKALITSEKLSEKK